MIDYIEPDIKFSFKKESVIKYDDTLSHDKCKHASKKGVDFIYKYGSKLMLIEVKDFNRDTNNKTHLQKDKILKATYKTLQLDKSNPFDLFVEKIIQKINDTLLDLYSSIIIDSKSVLIELNSRIKEIIFIVVVDLPNDMKEYLSPISDKITQCFKKYSCIFHADIVVIDSNSRLNSFKMQKISKVIK